MKAKSMIIKGSDNNGFLLGHIDKNMYFGKTPRIHWDADATIKKAMVFKKLHVSTCFNPAYIIDHLQQNGFTVVEPKEKSNKNFADISLSKFIDGTQIEFHNIMFFFNMVTGNFMSVNAVIGLIDACMSKINEIEGSSGRIDFRVVCHPFSKREKKKALKKMGS